MAMWTDACWVGHFCVEPDIFVSNRAFSVEPCTLLSNQAFLYRTSVTITNNAIDIKTHIFCSALLYSVRWIYWWSVTMDIFIDIQHYSEVTGTTRCTKSPATPLFAQPFIQALTKENMKCSALLAFDGNPSVTSGFPSQRVSNVERASIWWRHHEYNHCKKQQSFTTCLSTAGAISGGYCSQFGCPRRPTRTITTPVKWDILSLLSKIHPAPWQN